MSIKPKNWRQRNGFHRLDSSFCFSAGDWDLRLYHLTVFGSNIMNDFSWTKSIATLVFALLLIAGAVWYTYYTWSDCLEENSFITCARMLGK